MASTELESREAEESAEAARGGDGDTGAHVAPIVHLDQEAALTTREENEDILLDFKAKLYRLDKEGIQWKERGDGTVKILKHRETAKVRLVMQQGKTLKICANHVVVPSIKIQEHVGNHESCVWHASDFSDGVLKEETFCIRFGTVETCRRFMDMFDEVA